MDGIEQNEKRQFLINYDSLDFSAFALVVGGGIGRRGEGDVVDVFLRLLLEKRFLVFVTADQR